MDPLKASNIDELIENAIRCEPFAEPPVDFSCLFLEQVSQPQPQPFRIFSWVDILASSLLAITFGIALTIPFLIPDQMIPQLSWILQYSKYLLMKLVFTLPTVITIAAAVVSGIGLFLLVARLSSGFFSRFGARQTNLSIFLLN